MTFDGANLRRPEPVLRFHAKFAVIELAGATSALILRRPAGGSPRWHGRRDLAGEPEDAVVVSCAIETASTAARQRLRGNLRAIQPIRNVRVFEAAATVHDRIELSRSVRDATTLLDHIVSALSADARRRLQPHMEHIRLSAGQQLYDIGEHMRHVLFIEHGVVSLVAATLGGQTTEIAMIGRGDVMAVPSIWPMNTAPCRVLVSFPGDGHLVRADIVRLECGRDVSMQNALLDDAHRVLVQMAQAVACHRYHTAMQRICRWLLRISARVPTSTIPLTQDAIGQVVGADRKRVSLAATLLRDDGCIRQHRGQIKILNRIGLQQRACDCYTAEAV